MGGWVSPTGSPQVVAKRKILPLLKTTPVIQEEELCNLYFLRNIIWMIKSKTMRQQGL
jgi:hypothetical protein